MATISLNFNQTVRVRLTDVGRARIRQLVARGEMYQSPVERNGETEFLLHELMTYFGDLVGIGRPVPFSMDAELQLRAGQDITNP